MLMQLRKACNHPYLFEWPEDDEGKDLIDDGIINSAGKMQVLDRILQQTMADGDKVLIFSQMTKMLDILEDYMSYKGYSYRRLDGSCAQSDRQESVRKSNSASTNILPRLSSLQMTTCFAFY
jgi:SNF2 family DNA or RNA helicase